MRKILSVFLASVLMMCCIPAYSADSEIVIDSLTIDETGSGEVVGHITVWNENTNITFLAMTAEKNADSVISGDEIIYVNQATVGNNGVFMFEFCISPRFSGRDAIIRFGSTEAEAITLNYTLPVIVSDILSVPNNSVMYGQDVYRVQSIYLSTEYVTDSIIHGGNVIFFKLGDEWYDLTDEDATSAEYLVPENAQDISYMAALPFRYYYALDKMIEFSEGV